MEPAAQETINKLQAELKQYQECLNEARALFDIEPVEQQGPATFLINFKMFVDEFRVKSEMIGLLESGEGIQQLRAENEALRKQLEYERNIIADLSLSFQSAINQKDAYRKVQQQLFEYVCRQESVAPGNNNTKANDE